MRRSTFHHPIRMLLMLAALGVCLLVPLPAGADMHCFGPYTISSAGNYAPGSDGDLIRDWSGAFTVQLEVTTGPLTVNVEAHLPGMSFGYVGGINSNVPAQFVGPFERLRYLQTGCGTCTGGDDDGDTCNGTNCSGGTCSDCLGKITACATKGD